MYHLFVQRSCEHPLTSHRYDLRATFDVLVGQAPAERFAVHTDVLTAYSKFLAATRKPEWLAGNASRPVDLSDEDPEVFQAYLNCVYFGPKALREHIVEFERQMSAFKVELFVCVAHADPDEDSVARFFEKYDGLKRVRFKKNSGVTCSYYVAFDTAENAAKASANIDGQLLGGRTLTACTSGGCERIARLARSGLADNGSEALIRLFLLADKLQDLTTVNMVMDQLVEFIANTNEIPKVAPTSFAYNSTASSNPLRAFLRDCWVYRMPTDGIDHFKTDDFPKDFLQDVATELMCLKQGAATSEDYEQNKGSNKCLYHQHDNEHPTCGA